MIDVRWGRLFIHKEESYTPPFNRFNFLVTAAPRDNSISDLPVPSRRQFFVYDYATLSRPRWSGPCRPESLSPGSANWKRIGAGPERLSFFRNRAKNASAFGERTAWPPPSYIRVNESVVETHSKWRWWVCRWCPALVWSFSCPWLGLRSNLEEQRTDFSRSHNTKG